MNKNKQKLLKERAKLMRRLSKLEKMLPGVYPIWRKCGKSRCRCQKGFLHGPVWALHYREKGKIKSLYIPKNYLKETRLRSRKYKQYKEIGKKICLINTKLLELESKKFKSLNGNSTKMRVSKSYSTNKKNSLH